MAMLMNVEDKFLPKKITFPVLPPDWEGGEAVERIKELTSIAKPAVKDIIVEFWVAHEMIVKGLAKEWTWEKFCKATGYDPYTPYRWFERYRMTITKVTHREKKITERPEPAKAGYGIEWREPSELEKRDAELEKALGRCWQTWEKAKENEFEIQPKFYPDVLEILEGIRRIPTKTFSDEFKKFEAALRKLRGFKDLLVLREILFSLTERYAACFKDIDLLICHVLSVTKDRPEPLLEPDTKEEAA